MKAYEVKMNIIGGSEGETKIYFVQAETKKQMEGMGDVVKVRERKDVTTEECPYEYDSDLKIITQKENYVSPY